MILLGLIADLSIATLDQTLRNLPLIFSDPALINPILRHSAKTSMLEKQKVLQKYTNKPHSLLLARLSGRSNLGFLIIILGFTSGLSSAFGR
jgi:hypothetical protein